MARLTTFPPFNEFTPACELCAATAVEPAGAAPEGLLAELLCAFELTPAGLGCEAAASPRTGSILSSAAPFAEFGCASCDAAETAGACSVGTLA